MTQKTRGEMDPRHQWELSHIFQDRAAWEAALEKAQQAVAGISAYRGTLGSIQGAKAALDAYYALAEQAERIYLYAELTKAGDNGDQAAQAMQDRAMGLLVNLGAAASYLTPELAALPLETLEGYAKAEALSGYRHGILDIIRSRAYVLSPEQEHMLALLADPAQTPDNAFSMLSEVDMALPSIQDETGETVQLTHGNYGVYRESKDRGVRQRAFEAYFGAFNGYINTFAALYGGSVKLDCYFAKVRKHANAQSAALFANNVPTAVYDSLIAAVHEKLPAMEQYLALRKKALGLSELHMYDLYCPMVQGIEETYTLEQAKTMVKEALAPLGPDYIRQLEQGLTGGWIDAYENKGKTTGAFSCGVYGVHPYVLLNYTDTLDDVFTLAHEMGHAIHSYRSDQAQTYANHDYAIFVAEVASTVNEVLLTLYLLEKETDPRKRAYYLNHFLEGFRTTLFRQTLFAEFEKQTHEMAEAGQPLTPEALNQVYRALNAQYYKGAVIDPLQDMEWARIPHFYNAFYVYQYATGFSAAVAIAAKIRQTGDAAGYLAFLQTGGSDYPIQELKLAGVDLSKPDTVEAALDVFAKSVAELEALLQGLE